MERLSDHQLLKRYCHNQDERAFALLASRHVNLVYGTALRRVRGSHLAEEVTQAVFLELAKAAPTFSPRKVICAWLHQVARNKSVDLVRSEISRKKREQIAVEIQCHSNDNDQWMLIEPLLDDAIATLNIQDRTAILLRYFESKSFREIGHALDASEEAARKRVHRSVQRLWKYFSEKGLIIHTDDFGSLLTTRATIAAPVGLALSVGSIVQSLAAPTVVSTAIKALTMTYIKKSALAGAIAITIGTGVFQRYQTNQWKESSRKLQSAYTQDQQKWTVDLRGERDLRETAQKEIVRLKKDLEDLHRLRAAATNNRLTLAKLQRERSGRAVVSASATALIDRFDILKNQFELMPDSWIPEMVLLTEDDWLQAARREINNELDLRRSMSELRGYAEKMVVSEIAKAVRKHKEVTGLEFPQTIKGLGPYLDEGIDETVLSRWDLVPEKSVKGIRTGDTEYVITQKEPIDEIFDKMHVIGPNGQASTDVIHSVTSDALLSVYKEYEESNNGRPFEALQELLPFVETSEQQAALEKLLLRESALGELGFHSGRSQ